MPTLTLPFAAAFAIAQKQPAHGDEPPGKHPRLVVVDLRRESLSYLGGYAVRRRPPAVVRVERRRAGRVVGAEGSEHRQQIAIVGRCRCWGRCAEAGAGSIVVDIFWAVAPIRDGGSGGSEPCRRRRRRARGSRTTFARTLHVNMLGVVL